MTPLPYFRLIPPPTSLSCSCSQTSFSHLYAHLNQPHPVHHVHSSNNYPRLRRHHPPHWRLQQARRAADVCWHPRNNHTRSHNPRRALQPIPQLRQLPPHPASLPRLCACLRTRRLSARRPVFEVLSVGKWPFAFVHEPYLLRFSISSSSGHWLAASPPPRSACVLCPVLRCGALADPSIGYRSRRRPLSHPSHSLPLANLHRSVDDYRIDSRRRIRCLDYSSGNWTPRGDRPL